ncbi:MAG: class I SAM-dependent methyltransferase [Hyphomicrobiales bacterium]|nr:class I SAM-dependent methyltransferase [Hyphomicrobiales bacterium]
MRNTDKKRKRLADDQDWNAYFEENGKWELNGGRQQSRLFAEAFCEHTCISVEQGDTLLDSSAALGDSLPALRKRFPHVQLIAYDFSSVAIRRAEQRFSELATFSTKSMEEITDNFDIIYSSNTLEHFSAYKDKTRALLQQCRYLCILVPFDEQHNGKDLEYNPYADHVVTFRHDTFDFLLDEGLAKEIFPPQVFRVPKAWSWSTKDRIVQPLKNIVRLLLNRPLSRDQKSILFEIERAERNS